MGIAVFDINETTLDLAPLRAAVDELVGPEGGFTVWFQRLLQLSTTLTASGRYEDFTVLAPDALHAVAATSGRALGPEAVDRLRDAFGSLRAYPDVPGGLERLRDANWTIVALTNSAQTSVDNHLAGAGLNHYFDQIVSVDSVRTYKPSAAPYRHVAELLDAHPSDMTMVACHDWDLAGARAVGYRTAYVRRPHMSYASVYTPPDHDVEDFAELAAELMRA